MNKSLKIVLIILMLVSQPVIVYGQNDIRQLTDSKASLNKESGTLTLDHWNYVDVSISMDGKTPTSSSETSDKTWLYYDSLVSQIYEVPRGIEWDIIITSTTQNSFNFKIDSTERLDWFYQPSLVDELIGIEYFGWTINETHAFDETGSLVFLRPVDVVGSYAVYGEKQDNKFKTGKILHVYRPRIYDSKGTEIWGELNYNSGILSVSVEQSWLDKAVLPVTIDPSFGYDIIGASSNGGQFQNYAYSNHNHTLTENATVSSISAYLDFDNVRNVVSAIYNISLNLPDSRKVNSSFTAVGALNWYNFSVNNQSLIAGEYALALGNCSAYTATQLWFYDTVDAGTGYYCYDGNDLSPTWSNDGTGATNRRYSIYVNYNISAPSPPAPAPIPTPLGDLEAWDINWFISLLWITIMAVALLKGDHILTMFAGFFGIILGLTLLNISPMTSVALILLNLYLIYEGTG